MQKLAEFLALLAELPATEVPSSAFQAGRDHYVETANLRNTTEPTPAAFATFLALTLAEAGEHPEIFADGADMVVRLGGWQKPRSHTRTRFDDLAPFWTNIWRGALSAHNPQLHLTEDQRMDRGDAVWQWRICAEAQMDASLPDL